LEENRFRQLPSSSSSQVLIFSLLVAFGASGVRGERQEEGEAAVF